jgi:hypothetical protein
MQFCLSYGESLGLLPYAFSSLCRSRGFREAGVEDGGVESCGASNDIIVRFDCKGE